MFAEISQLLGLMHNSTCVDPFSENLQCKQTKAEENFRMVDRQSLIYPGFHPVSVGVGATPSEFLFREMMCVSQKMNLAVNQPSENIYLYIEGHYKVWVWPVSSEPRMQHWWYGHGSSPWRLLAASWSAGWLWLLEDAQIHQDSTQSASSETPGETRAMGLGLELAHYHWAYPLGCISYLLWQQPLDRGLS